MNNAIVSSITFSSRGHLNIVSGLFSSGACYAPIQGEIQWPAFLQQRSIKLMWRYKLSQRRKLCSSFFLLFSVPAFPPSASVAFPPLENFETWYLRINFAEYFIKAEPSRQFYLSSRTNSRTQLSGCRKDNVAVCWISILSFQSNSR